MKAAYYNETGTPDVIQVSDLPAPVPAAGQVLVRVGAASVNPIDTYIRSGAVAMKLPKPFIPGCDLAGRVEAVGSGVSRFKVGDRVWGSNQGLLGRQGTAAEYAAVDEEWLYPTPDGATDETMAAVALVGITAHLGLVRCARVAAGETVFVNGGSGGVGSMVVQMARNLGARVIATAGGPDHVERCRRMGVAVAIDYRTEDVSARIAEAAPGGVNVWWETQREPDFDRTVSLLARHGRMVLMAGREARPVFPVGPFYVKCCSLHGFAMFNFTAEEQAPCAAAIGGWIAEGRLEAPIGRVMPLSEVAAAHRLQEDNTLRKAGTLSGKIVIKVS